MTSVSADAAEIRLRGSQRRPQVVVRQGSGTKQEIEIRRASLAGCWRCILSQLKPGKKYSVELIVREEDKQVLSFQTLNVATLGKHRLRIGMLADAHINLLSYNGKRLYGSANQLLEKYTKKLVDHHKVDCLVLPGDVCDSGQEEELQAAAKILNPIRHQGVPVYAVIGNHEESPSRFAKLLVPQSSDTGYYSMDHNGVHLILLATDTQESLNDGSKQLQWLREDLAKHQKCCDIILVIMHYSLILHPLHNKGRWDDGMQLLENASDILQLLHSYPSVKAVFCGHKNVPSMLVDDSGLLHTLSPQPIQVPCAYDVFDVYDQGVTRVVYEIEEMDLQDVSRRAAGELESRHRSGIEEHRNFTYMWSR